uniref:Uncharacterized protein n=1 Tax=Arundo donax TaxID=35708 RepID=A0A0A9BMD3_ARUDO
MNSRARSNKTKRSEFDQTYSRYQMDFLLYIFLLFITFSPNPNFLLRHTVSMP